MTVQIQTKIAVSVSEMARMVGLSRARFYQLLTAGVFPSPLRDPSKNRPYFDEEQQKRCLEVRRRNCGINGEPILFYTKRLPTAPVPKRKQRTAKKKMDYNSLIESLKALGLTTSKAQVEVALASLYPDGTDGMDESEFIRKVFLHLKRQTSANNVGR